MRILQKRSVVLAVAVLIVFLLTASAGVGKFNFPIAKRLVAIVLTPFESALAKVSLQIRSSVRFVGEIADVYHDNQSLKAEKEHLLQQTAQIQEVLAENARLKGILDYKKNTPQYRMVIASIIARDTATWSSTVMIDRGSSDGITKDMPVVTSRGLIGHVTQVFPYSARILLITDATSAVGVLVQRLESRVAGIVKGADVPVLAPRMVNLARDADVIKGDKIITSGLGGIYPKGLPIGEVTDVVNEEGGLLKYAVIKPVVDFDRLEEVQILLYTQDPLRPVVPGAPKEQGQ